MIRAIVLAGCALALAGAKDDPLAGRAAGKPVDCIDPRGTNPTILDARTIAYTDLRRRMWVAHPVGSCGTLRQTSVLIIERFGTELCSSDRFRVIEPPATIPGGMCRFGPFVPYDLPTRR